MPPLETGHRHLSKPIKQFINWCENTHGHKHSQRHMCKHTHTLSHLCVNTHTDVMGIPWTHCLLTHYLGSKRQQLGGEKTRRAIICWEKLHAGVMFVLWQNGGLVHFTKLRDLSSSSLSCESLWNPQSMVLIKARREWIRASVVIRAWRYERDPHDHCPFPHHYSNSHGCNRLNWAHWFLSCTLSFNHKTSLCQFWDTPSSFQQNITCSKTAHTKT